MRGVRMDLAQRGGGRSRSNREVVVLPALRQTPHRRWRSGRPDTRGVLRLGKEDNGKRKDDRPCGDPRGIGDQAGFVAGRDHLLTVGVCDGDGREVLYLELCPPLECDAWPRAEAVNGISPIDVLDKPTIEDARAVLQGVLDAASTIVCYNAGFDLKFLEADGFTYPDEVSDVMLDFAEIYGEYDSRHHDYKWQKLVKCAEYYGCPEFEAHNSLGDAQATAWCWRHVQRDMLSRGGCDLEAEARDASDASRCRSGAIKADRDRVVR